MSSASFFVFCTASELIDWVCELCKEKGLGCIIFRDTADSGLIADPLSKITLYEDTYQMYLYPKSDTPKVPLTMNDVNARGWGWVDVRPGRLKEENSQKILTYSEMHGEDFEYEPVHPAKYVRWLKKRLKNVINAGIKGRNVVTGGESTYRDIYYTSSAYNLYLSGVVWKQFFDGRAIFEPAKSERN